MDSRILLAIDFGDAPDPNFPTLLPGGAQHTIVSGFHLGTLVDAEADGQPTADATGDDTDGSNDVGSPTAYLDSSGTGAGLNYYRLKPVGSGDS